MRDSTEKISEIFKLIVHLYRTESSYVFIEALKKVDARICITTTKLMI